MDDDFGLVSSTQYEALHARRVGMPVWYCLLDDRFSRDSCPSEPEQLARAQSAYVGRVREQDPSHTLIVMDHLEDAIATICVDFARSTGVAAQDAPADRLIRRDQSPRVQIMSEVTSDSAAPVVEASAPSPPFVFDQDVQFTVYRPQAMAPAQWYTWLAFAHRGPATPEEPDHAAEVEAQAQTILGASFEEYANARQESSAALPREGTITVVPSVDGLEFNPRQRSFVWQEPVHREEFRARAVAAGPAGIRRGRITFFLGALVVAEINVKVSVAPVSEAAARPAMTTDRAHAYRQIFASYSRRDTAVVEHFERMVATFGDRYLRDVHTLRAGEEWGPGLERMIREADVFQLFWSSNSMRSRYVRQEWEYALGLGRPNFVRPTFWEDPCPRDEAASLPPDALSRLHFVHLPFTADPDVGKRSDVIPAPAPPPEAYAPSPLPPPPFEPESCAAASGPPEPSAAPRRAHSAGRARFRWLPALAVAMLVAGVSSFFLTNNRGVVSSSPPMIPLGPGPQPVPTIRPSPEPDLDNQKVLADRFFAAGEYANAERGYRSILAIQERILGVEETDTLATRYRLALTLEKERNYPEALELATQAEAGFLKIAGAEKEMTKEATALRQRLEKEGK